jgi:hypothetical protein
MNAPVSPGFKTRGIRAAGEDWQAFRNVAPARARKVRPSAAERWELGAAHGKTRLRRPAQDIENVP